MIVPTYETSTKDLQEQLNKSEERYRIRSKAYNNILLENAQLEEEKEDLQRKIDKAKKILNANTHTENIYEALCNLLLDDNYKYEICDEELLEILKGDSNE